MTARGDASEFFRLARDLGEASASVLPAIRPGFQQGAEMVKRGWQENARATAGAHGKHYPNSITFETRVLATSLVAEVGPDSSRPQGGMGPGFEFGSRNQPPHLDGNKAVDALGPRVEQAIDSAIARVIP